MLKLNLIKILKAKSGESLIESLAAVTIISILLPSLFLLPAGILKSIQALKHSDTCRYAAQFWFSRLPDFKNIKNISDVKSKLNAMPDYTPDKSAKFNLRECTAEADGSFKIILEIQDLKYDADAKNILVVTGYI